jgi:hypothetical protein
MSKIFSNTNFSDLFDTITESNAPLPQWITIVDKANNTELSATSTADMNMMGGNYSVTSSQVGGNGSEQDVNKLISMLTSESNTPAFNGLSETSTISLETQLRDILNKESKQTGGSNVSVDSVKNFFNGLKNQGVNVNVSLNDQTLSEFFATKSSRKTFEMRGGAGKKKGSKKGSKKAGSKKGSKKAGSKKGGSKKGSKAGSKRSGASNPGFEAFLKLKKHIAEKLGVSNGPNVGKVAGAVQRDMKEKFPNLESVEISKKAMEHFDNNVAHYKQMLPK